MKHSKFNFRVCVKWIRINKISLNRGLPILYSVYKLLCETWIKWNGIILSGLYKKIEKVLEVSWKKNPSKSSATANTFPSKYFWKFMPTSKKNFLTIQDIIFHFSSNFWHLVIRKRHLQRLNRNLCDCKQKLHSFD